MVTQEQVAAALRQAEKGWDWGAPSPVELIRAHITALEAKNKQLREALVQCESELMSIHIQHGDKAHAAEMSAGIRMAKQALEQTADDTSEAKGGE